MRDYNFFEAQMSPKNHHEFLQEHKTMTNTTHTPAPWGISKRRNSGGNYSIKAQVVIDIAAVYHPEWGYDAPAREETALANALLIAAAPDMLAALQALMQEAGIDENDLASLAQSEAFKMAWDAINKAMGAA
jgi:predicted metal-dependent phosphoesterase TrpH